MSGHERIPLNRRSFLRGTAAAAIAAAVSGCRRDDREPVDSALAHAPASPELGIEEDISPELDRRLSNQIRVLLHEADGQPLDSIGEPGISSRSGTLYARDLNNDPLPQAIARASGRARIELADEPIQLVCRLKVPGFGEVYCYADNDGRGWSRPQDNIEFVVDAAKTRLRRVEEALEENGFVRRHSDFRRHLAVARRPIPVAAGTSTIAAAYEALAGGLHAGEILALERARRRISRFSRPRDDFGFGVMVSRFGTNSEYDRAVEELFDHATVSWYTWKDEEPPEQRVDYARMDASIDWCLSRNITPKGFGYCYMARGATPEWIRPIEMPATTLPSGQQLPARREFNERWPWERVRKLYADVNRQTCRRYLEEYGDRVPVVEVLNEAHDKANLWHLSQARILEVAAAVTRAAREGHPTVQRQINHCCQWAEYARNRNVDGSRRWSPYTFVRDCLDYGVEFESLGLQLYYPSYDLLEIDRMLDRHMIFDKPIHITELSTHAADGLDPESMRPRTLAPGWHGPWSEQTQADWAEAIFTLCYSKPLYKVVGWWDLADLGGHFWPHGGLLRKDMSRKPSYDRLLKLKKSWGLA